MGGLSAGQSQSGRAGCGRGDPGGVRQGSEEQSVQDLESDVLGVLFSASGEGGGTRVLGVPTISDRVAQTVVARRLELKVEPIFHPDSYGYRPYRSALDA